MNSANDVSRKLEELKSCGIPLQEVAWKFALLCVGWAYVYGARGDLCTPANRRARDWERHPTIKSACRNFDGSAGCSGCKWYPDGERTRCFDCRGFTYWVLLQVYGWRLDGHGATSQWNNDSNWSAKGTIDSIPQDQLVCLFVRKGETMEHTGFGFCGQTVECGNGVERSKKRDRKWTHWALPACVAAAAAASPSGSASASPAADPEPVPETGHTTLRRGSRGAEVKALQDALIAQGFSCGKWGADGDFGSATEKAVKVYQEARGLSADGIVGPVTWAALEAEREPEYTVTITHLSKSQADALMLQYPGSTMNEERG